MEITVMDAPATTAIEIPEPTATNQIVPFQPQIIDNAPTALARSETPEIVDATWRIVDTPQPAQPHSFSLPGAAGPASMPMTRNDRPHMQNQPDVNAWPAQARTQAPTATVSAAAQQDSAKWSFPLPSATGIADLIFESLEGLGFISNFIANSIDGFLSFLLGPLAPGGGGKRENRYTPADKALFVTPLHLGETIVAHLVAGGLPTNYEGIENRKGYMPEYRFSISAHHIRWCLRLLRDYGCVAGYSKERELYEVILKGD
jgi:hypothetical protein